MSSACIVTGCAGFIGSRVAAQLLEAGSTVIGIDNLNDYYDVRLKEHRLQNLRSASPAAERFDFFPVDLEDQTGVASVFDAHPEVSIVFNLAARAGVRYSMENPHIYMTTNAMGSLNLLEEMRRRSIPKYVLASTSSLYAGQPTPFLESLPVNTPISPYAASKKAAEVMAYSYHHLYGIDVSICRYFTVYGPAGRPDMSIFRFIRWMDAGQQIELFGDGTQARDFTYVDDIARGTILAGREVGFEIFNLGGGNEPVTLLDILSRLERMIGKPAQVDLQAFHKADIKVTMADIAKARTMLGWSPQTDLDTGLRRSVEWYMEHKPWSESLVLP